jgi:hypothetical protein
MAAVKKVVRLPQAHDITKTRPGEFKGLPSDRGHVIKESDAEHLRRLDYGSIMRGFPLPELCVWIS